MKCVLDFYKIEETLKAAAIEYLKQALEAHGGFFSWLDDNEMFREDICAPVVACNLDSGPCDMKIRCLSVDGNDIDCIAEDDQFGGITELELSDIVSSSHIQSIIEYLPAPTISNPKN